MKVVKPGTIYTQIKRILLRLAEMGLSDDQQIPIRRNRRGGVAEITFGNAELVSRAMRKRPYREIYKEFVQHRVFSAKLLDGALVQMAYAFDESHLAKHRLAFLSSPYLMPFREDRMRYIDDERYAHILSRIIDPVSIRFDYDRSDSRHQEVWHPKSHLTIGNYEGCRVPVSSPLTPFAFMQFVFRSFYSTPDNDFASGLPNPRAAFPRSISQKEEAILHVVVPQ